MKYIKLIARWLYRLVALSVLPFWGFFAYIAFTRPATDAGKFCFFMCSMCVIAMALFMRHYVKKGELRKVW